MSAQFQKLYSLQESCKLFISKLQNYSLHKIPEAISEILLTKMSVEYFKKGTFFCRQDDVHTRAGMLLDGAAKAFSLGDDNQKAVMKFFCNGEIMFDEQAQNGAVSERFIEFVCDSGVLIIDDLPQLTDIFLNENLLPDILNIYMGFYKEELHNTQSLSQIRNIPDSKMRISEFYKKFSGMDRYFSGSDIAALIGISRETFSRNRNEVLRYI
jgi:hypothetical protein